MIEVLRPGQFTTVQDLGRFGYRSMGVPVSGPMDSESALLANSLLGNDPNAPILEMAYVGATFLFHNDAVVAFAGAKYEVKMNEKTIENQSILSVKTGSTLSFGAMKHGNFLYLSIVGGFKVETTLGSACYFEAVNGLTRINKGVRLFFEESLQDQPVAQTISIDKKHASSSIIEVEKGPEFNLLSAMDISALMKSPFSISPQSNRMGLLLNENIAIQLDEIISSPVQPGTIQLTKGGQLIVLMRDAQTTGGYPRILHLSEKSINQLAQFPLNTPFTFHLVD